MSPKSNIPKKHPKLSVSKAKQLVDMKDIKSESDSEAAEKEEDSEYEEIEHNDEKEEEDSHSEGVEQEGEEDSGNDEDEQEEESDSANNEDNDMPIEKKTNMKEKKNSPYLVADEEMTRKILEEFENEKDKILLVDFKHHIPTDLKILLKNLKDLCSRVVKVARTKENLSRQCLVFFDSVEDRVIGLKKFKEENTILRTFKLFIDRNEDFLLRCMGYIIPTIKVKNIPIESTSAEIKALFPTAIDLEVHLGSFHKSTAFAKVKFNNMKEAENAVNNKYKLGENDLDISLYNSLRYRNFYNSLDHKIQQANGRSFQQFSYSRGGKRKPYPHSESPWPKRNTNWNKTERNPVHKQSRPQNLKVFSHRGAEKEESKIKHIYIKKSHEQQRRPEKDGASKTIVLHL